MTTIEVRDFDADFSQVPRAWFAQNPVATAIANGVNMLFPVGERFFVRSVKHYLDEITDPELRAQIKAFFGQEGRHARAHDEFNAILRGQGYRIDDFLERYERIIRWVEARMPPKLRLAATAACEHYTAIMAEGAFTRPVLDIVHPTMRALLAWHAAEEIEHRAVAFDVLQRVDPSYGLRLAGLVVSTAMLGGFWIWAAGVLLREDQLPRRDLIANLRRMRSGGHDAQGTYHAPDPIVRRVFLRGIRSYLRRDFHPSQTASDELVASWFAARGMTLPKAA